MVQGRIGAQHRAREGRPLGLIRHGHPDSDPHERGSPFVHRRGRCRCNGVRHPRRCPVRAERRQSPGLAGGDREGRAPAPGARGAHAAGVGRVRRALAIRPDTVHGRRRGRGSSLRTVDADPRHVPNTLLDDIASIPVVLVVAADLSRIAMMDKDLERPPITGGASIYPFCWSILLAARARGLGGVMTTFLSRAEPAAGAALGLPPDHALATTIFLGYPVDQPTRLRRRDVAELCDDRSLRRPGVHTRNADLSGRASLPGCSR